ncbi:ATP synthase subunit delta, chloroplastic-like [Canna indica]|uniref:ATP synthase subunit delta, chloroplastic-like n=1 Tax=Canna indica TaxID=4628 RepID=A0AAQ3KSQ6_9LILI|nr:ATP synthase subunit delta, chloroplastic-like [Canna indica]
MAALRPSPSALRASSPSYPAASAAPISSSLRRLPSARRRLSSLKLAFPRSAPSSSSRRRGAAMMDTAAASYANALADVAKSNGTLDETVADMEKVESLFADPAVQSFFANPTVARETKLEVVKEIAVSSELQPHTVNFLNILVDMKRIDIVGEIAKELEACYNRITGTEVAVVTSVVEIEENDLSQIAQTVKKLTGAKKVRIKTVLDPSLIAGFTIRYGPSGSKFIDMSVKKQLDEISSQLDFSNISLA